MTSADRPDPDADATFIAASRTDVPALTAYVKELEAERDDADALLNRITELRQALERAREDMAPWYRDGDLIVNWSTARPTLSADAVTNPVQVGQVSNVSDAALIAEARNALPALLAVARAAQVKAEWEADHWFPLEPWTSNPIWQEMDANHRAALAALTEKEGDDG